MDDTGFQVPQRRMPRFVANYLLTPKGLQPFDMPPDTIYALKPAFPFGGSGLVSTARDYSRFTAMLLGEGRYGSRRIMLPETAATMMSNLLPKGVERSEEHTSELQSLMRISYAVFCLKKKNKQKTQ